MQVQRERNRKIEREGLFSWRYIIDAMVAAEFMTVQKCHKLGENVSSNGQRKVHYWLLTLAANDLGHGTKRLLEQFSTALGGCM